MGKFNKLINGFDKSYYLPKVVSDLINYIKYIYMSSNPLLVRNKNLRGKHNESRCFILGTGPSILKQDLLNLKGEYSIGVNNFYLHPDFGTIAPKYYCMTPYHPEVGINNWQKWMDEFDRSIMGLKMILFFNLNDKDKLFQKKRFENKEIYFINFDRCGKFNHNYEMSKPLFPVQSVSIMALYVALQLGFKEVFLLGCDHDWIFHYKKTRHFYPEDKSSLSKNGFSEWFKSTDMGYDYSSLASLWDQYRLIREYSLRKKINIFYSTPKGKLDIFPIKKIKDIFQKN